MAPQRPARLSHSPPLRCRPRAATGTTCTPKSLTICKSLRLELSRGPVSLFLFQF